MEKDIENSMGKFVRDFRILTEQSGIVNYEMLRDGLRKLLEQELDKAREEGKKEAFTKDEWFMLKLAMNDIFNNGNTAYEEISEKIESYLN